jgi:hypothetical protein
MNRGFEAAVSTLVPADRSKGKKHIPREGDYAGLHEKRYSSYLLKGNAGMNCPGLPAGKSIKSLNRAARVCPPCMKVNITVD